MIDLDDMADQKMEQFKKISAPELKGIRKILIIQYKPFGDILLNTGYMPTLRRKFPEAQIDYLIQRPYVTLLEDNPYLDNLILMEKIKKHTIRYYMERFRIMRIVREKKYDLVIDQLRGPGSAQITLYSGAKYKLGWQQKRWNWVYNYKVVRDNFRYYSRAKFDLLKPLGIEEEPHNTYYKIQDESIDYIEKWLKKMNLTKEKIVVFSPGTPVLRKQWSLDYYAKLGDMILNKTEFKLILLWGPGEKKDVEYVENKMESKAIISPPTTFNQAGALLKNADMFIGNDGGINHLAVAMETPSITIFGPTTNPKKWTAWHKDIHLYLRDWEFKNRNDNTFNISPEQVFYKFKKFFKL